MQVRPINAQTWLGAFKINQAIEVTAGTRVLYVSGVKPSNEEAGSNGGSLSYAIGPGDLAAQLQVSGCREKPPVEVLAAAAYDQPVKDRAAANLYHTDLDAGLHGLKAVTNAPEQCRCPRAPRLNLADERTL